jgi:PTH1 family peptidyl-tRNA hydrolase
VKLVIGLGNPGTRYEKTRHNLGFMVIDELARRHTIDVSQEKFSAWFGTGHIQGHRVGLGKPTTFMNRSGQAVHAAGRFYKIEFEDLLVIVDDLALPTGRIRFKPGGRSGGHNGLADISARLGTEDYARLRIGIGSGLGDAASHVLGRIGQREQELLDTAIQRSADAVTCWITEGVTNTMNRYNATARGANDENGDGKSEEQP